MDNSNRIALLNSIANQPAILKAIAPACIALDLRKFFDEPRNLMLGDERGVILFAYFMDLGDGPFYEIHYLLTDKLKGRDKFRAAWLAINAVFREKRAAVIFGSTPVGNRAARVMNRLLGGRPDAACVDAQERNCVRYVLDRKTWDEVNKLKPS